jgi:hypothetical protein
VSAPLQAIVFFFLFLNVLLQLANKKWDLKQNKNVDCVAWERYAAALQGELSPPNLLSRVTAGAL